MMSDFQQKKVPSNCKHGNSNFKMLQYTEYRIPVCIKLENSDLPVHSRLRFVCTGKLTIGVAHE